MSSMKINSSLLFLFVFISQISFSQITGSIIAESHEPLASVNIYIEDTFVGTTSNEEGKYELDITNTGSYTIVFKYLGYKTEKRTINVDTFPPFFIKQIGI